MGGSERHCLTLQHEKVPQSVELGELGRYIGMRRFHIGVATYSMLLGTVAASMTGPVPYVVADISEEYGVSKASASLISSMVVSLGGVFGVFGGGWLADQVGRRHVIGWSLLFSAIFSALHFALPPGGNFATLLVLRTLLGVPYGVFAVIIVPYMIEFFSDDVRGCAACGINLGWPLGNVYAIQLVRIAGVGNWRLSLAAPLVPAALGLVCMAWVPESPRWLFTAGRDEEGQRVLSRVFASKPLVGGACVGPAPRIVTRGGLSAQATGGESFWRRFSKLFGEEMRKTTTIACLLFFAIQGSTFSAWMWGPDILQGAARWPEGQKSSPKDLSGVFTSWEMLTIAGTVAGMTFCDVVGRKPILIFSFIPAVACFAVLMLRPPVAVAIVMWQVLGFANGLTWTVFEAYLAEVFPTVLRGTGCGLAAVYGRLGGGFGPPLVGLLLEDHFEPALAVVMVFFVVCAIIMAFAEETAGRVLPDTVDAISHLGSAKQAT